MEQDKYQEVIDKLQLIIDDTQQTINRFGATGMDELMPEDYDRLLEILGDAVKQQRAHTLAMLGQA